MHRRQIRRNTYTPAQSESNRKVHYVVTREGKNLPLTSIRVSIHSLERPSIQDLIEIATAEFSHFGGSHMSDIIVTATQSDITLFRSIPKSSRFTSELVK